MTAWVYCDTSAIAKRYVNEPGRAALTRALATCRVISSVVMPLELHAAFARRARQGTLAADRLPRLFQRVASDRRYWTLVEATQEVLRDAEALVELDALRTLDAIHVASARVFETRMRIVLTFVTADARQARAAARAGLATKVLA